MRAAAAAIKQAPHRWRHRNYEFRASHWSPIGTASVAKGPTSVTLVSHLEPGAADALVVTDRAAPRQTGSRRVCLDDDRVGAPDRIHDQVRRCSAILATSGPSTP